MDGRSARWSALAGLTVCALGVTTGLVPWSRDASAADGSVSATVETQPVPHGGDAADDPAIWVNPLDPALSAVVGTDKQGGLAVYDMAGAQLQYLPTGEMNNVDVRSAGPSAFRLGGRPISLVVAGNRSTNAIAVYELDPATRQLRDIAARAIQPSFEVYGSCLYRSAATGRYFAFVNSKSGQVEQWQLFDNGSGRVDATLVRSFVVGSQAEGCVADDELGHLYLGEETRGIWKYGAEPAAGDARTLVAATSGAGPLVGQVEGMSLSYGPGGTGLLIVSSQDNSSFVVYRREGDNGFVTSFTVVAGGSIDGTEDTDGVDVSAANLGPAFPSGALVVQDGKNDNGNQNFKLVPLERILA
jgi:3-phytase